MTIHQARQSDALVIQEQGQEFYKKHGVKEIKREEEKIVNEVIEEILMEKEL